MGAFRTTPVESLYAESGEPPLEIRRLRLSMNYYLKLKANPENPAYECVINPTLKEKFLSKPNETPTFGIRMLSECNKAEIDIDSVCDDPLSTDTPPWQLKNPTVNLTLTSFKKNETSDSIFRQNFLEQCSSYTECELIFTDGSLKDDSAAAAAVSGKRLNRQLQLRLPNGSSVYSAELRAIILALKLIYQSRNQSFLIVSDSLSALEAISTRKLTHPFLVDIHDLHTKLVSEGKIIHFMWAPSHTGIQGNETADKAARDALGMEIPRLPEQSVPFTDLRRKTLAYSLKLWQDRWSACKENKLYKTLPDLSKPHPLRTSNRKEESVLTRIHTGHTYLTHVHLLKREEAPWCHACDIGFSVSHFMTECADLYDQRVKYFGTSNLRRIFTEVSSTALFGFLKETGLYLKI